MLALLGEFTPRFKIKKCLIDNTTFRLHYHYTFVILCISSFLQTLNQFFGDNIDCDVGDGVEKSVFDVRKILDVKNVPLIPTPRRTNETDPGTKESSSSSQSSSTASSGSSASSSSSSEASKTASPAPPGPPASSDSSEASLSSKTSLDKEKPEANCNYELECQVSHEIKHSDWIM